MKRVIIAFIIAIAAIAVGLICLMAYSVSRGSDTFSHENSGMKLVNTQNVSLDSIDSVNILYQSDDVTFYTSDTNELILKEYMNYVPEDYELSSVNKSGNKVTVKCGKQKLHIISFRLFSSSTRIEIYLPADYSNKLNVETSSGNINSDLSFTLSEFTASSSSGNININEVHSDRISASASSGNITFQVADGDRQFSTHSGNIKVLGGAGDSSFDASSGNITIENASGHLEAEASSGNIDIMDSVGGGDITTTSGNIKYNLTSLTEDLDLHASSGDVRVSIPKEASFDFTAETSSGDIRTYFDDVLSYNKKGNEASGIVGTNPNININISTSSGNIIVND
ncbi:MAG: hypothetical protein K0S01_202 [Herbinix sp.]|jgi:lia operon protein LiaG|nr:hypothetical protein [Herbinix sp.]